MAKRYTPNSLVNAIFTAMTRLGIGKSYRYILSVKGRKTGRTYSTPVDVMNRDGRMYLVAAYGEVNWVRNIRTSGEATLRRGSKLIAVRARELEPSDTVEVLRQYYEEVPVTHAYFDVTADADDHEFEIEAKRHPTFEVEPALLVGTVTGPAR
jgi:deazaflavin-dependent oxidoreductase (nitroreductase family)